MDARVFVEPQQGATYDQQLAVARTSEAAGFDAFFRSDHYIHIGQGDPMPGPTDSWMTLAGIARETSRIRLGTLVTSATFRLPGPLAIAVAQLDAMSGGRIELGLGAGWHEAEHQAYGIPFPSVTERFDRLAEQLAVVTGLWNTPVDKTFSFAGRHYSLVSSPALPKPVQRPHPPVIVGGSGRERTPALAARFAAEFNIPFHPPSGAAAQFERVRSACAAIGRDPASLVYSAALTVCCGRDDAEVSKRADAVGQSVAALRSGGLAGSPAEIVDRLGSYGPAGAGASRIYFQIMDITDLDHVELIAAEVLPQL